MTGLDLEGRLEVVLATAAGRVEEVSIVNRRLTQAARMFVGRRPEEVTAMLPLLFSLCGQAQLIAGLRALEQAGGLAVSAATDTARRLMLAAETVLEHGQGMVRDWPALLGEAPDVPAARGLRAALGALRGALYAGRDWARCGGGPLQPDRPALARRLGEARRLIERAIFAGPGAYQIRDLRTWTDWTQTGATPAARLVRLIEERDLGGFGNAPVALLAGIAPEALSRRLNADEDGRFVARPTWDGAPRLSHPLARQADHPLVAALSLSHGTGVLPLVAARLVELQACLAEAEVLLGALMPESGCAEDAAPDGCGIGLAAAARGVLAHRVAVAGGTIRRYQILAPTEWNFHPGGALAQGLRGVTAGQDLDFRARLLIAALDPCVACAVMIADENGGRDVPG